MTKQRTPPKKKATRTAASPKSQQKRQRILEAAAKIFSQKGYSETTLSEIGAEANTFAGSLYYHFDSKDALVEELLNIGTRNVSEHVIRAVSNLPESTSNVEKLKLAIQVHITEMFHKDDFFTAYWKLVDQVPAEIRAKNVDAQRKYSNFLQDLIDAAQACGELRKDLDGHLVRLLIVGSTIASLDWYQPKGPHTPIEIANTLIELFLYGAATSGKAGASKSAPQKPAKSTNNSRIAKRP